jgi:hypothetical protein
LTSNSYHLDITWYHLEAWPLRRGASNFLNGSISSSPATSTSVWKLVRVLAGLLLFIGPDKTPRRTGVLLDFKCGISSQTAHLRSSALIWPTATLSGESTRTPHVCGAKRISLRTYSAFWLTAEARTRSKLANTRGNASLWREAALGCYARRGPRFRLQRRPFSEAL